MIEPARIWVSVEAVSWSWPVGTFWPLIHLSVTYQQVMIELHLCLGSAASIVTGLLEPSLHCLQHLDLLPKVLMQLLEAGEGTEGGWEVTVLWG